MRVLLIDDSVHDRRIIRRLVRRSTMDISVEEAVDISSALQLLAVEAFDCLLIDYRLPDGNGIELVQKFMATSISGPVPAIMLSGQPSDDLARLAMQTGLLDFLSKEGLNTDVLERALRNAVIKNEARLNQQGGIAAKVGPVGEDDPFATILSATRTLLGSEAIQAAIDLDAGAKEALERIHAVASS